MHLSQLLGCLRKLRAIVRDSLVSPIRRGTPAPTDHLSEPGHLDRIASLLEDRMPLEVESDGREDDWRLVGPAMLVAATRHLRALEHLQREFPSGIVAWQILRSMFEYVTTFAWVAADPEERVRRWLKYDYGQRIKVDNDLASLGEERVLEPATRERLSGYAPDTEPMPPFVDVAREADDSWAATFQQLNGHVQEDFRRFRLQYVWIYRNGSRYTHPSSHVVDPFVSGETPQLAIGNERPLDRDLALIGTAVLALGLTVAANAVPAIGLTADDVVEALA
jgi:hypothetical protein